MRQPARFLLVIATILAACVVRGPAVVLTPSGAQLRVEIADTPELRERGLMGRTSLADDAGMVFVWPEDTTSAFWMKDTLMPLSVAFIASDGTVLAMIDMEPCRADPCPVYDAHVAYRMALEVNKGAFARHGVRVGDRARLVP